MSLRLSTGRSEANLSYAPSLIHSSVNEEEIQVFHLFDASGSLALSERLTFALADRFLRTDEPSVTDPRSVRRDRAILIQNGLASSLTYRRDTWSLVPRYSMTLNQTEDSGGSTAGGNEEPNIVHALGVDGTKDILERNTLGAGYELTIGEFEATNDFVGHTGRGSFSRQLNPVTTGSLEGSISHRDVDGGADYTIYRGDVGISRDLGPRYTIVARVGYDLADVSGAGEEGDFTFSIRGSYTGKTVRFTLTAGQSIQETFLERENVGLTRTREGAGELRYEPTDRLALTLRARLAENRFLQSSGAVTLTPGADRTDLLFDSGLEAALRLTRLLSLIAGYSYGALDSSLRGLDYENNRVRVGLTATFE